MHPDRMINPSPARRRLWPFLLPVFIGVLLAAGWCGLWFYAADKAEAIRLYTLAAAQGDTWAITRLSQINTGQE